MSNFSILITRPEPDASTLAATLHEKGHTTLIDPLLTIEPTLGAKPQVLAALSNAPQAILITSANAVRTLAQFTDIRDIPLLTVGDASAETATRLGFTTLHSANGDVNDLAALAKEICRPKKAPLLHIAGSITAGDLSGMLEESGFTIQRIPAYEAVPTPELSDATTAALINCEIDIALFFSPRTAQIFDQLIIEPKREYLMKNIDMLALSERVTSALPWRSIHIAPTPTTEALLALIDTIKSDRMP